jgi:hypothetical protein
MLSRREHKPGNSGRLRNRPVQDFHKRELLMAKKRDNAAGKEYLDQADVFILVLGSDQKVTAGEMTVKAIEQLERCLRLSGLDESTWITQELEAVFGRRWTKQHWIQGWRDTIPLLRPGFCCLGYVSFLQFPSLL